jgi:hypothetical protein
MPTKPSTSKSAAGVAGAADQVVLMLVSGLADDVIRQECREQLKIPAARLDKLLAECRQRIALAANFDRAAELGKAIVRLQDCYARHAAIEDWKGCVATQKELNRLLRLYEIPAGPAPPLEIPADEESDQARAHLAGLFEHGDSLPLAELCRLAAARIVTA